MKITRFLTMIAVLLCIAIPAAAQLPAGTRLQPLVVNTNTSYVSWGSNGVTTLIFTNSLTFSNTVNVVGTFTASTNNTSVLTVSGNTTAKGLMLTPTYAIISTITNNDYSVTGVSVLVITNATVPNPIFTGFAGGVNGQQLTIVNNTLSNLWVFDSNASSVSENRINTSGYGSTNLTGTGVFNFIYLNLTTSSNWYLKSFIP